MKYHEQRAECKGRGRHLISSFPIPFAVPVTQTRKILDNMIINKYRKIPKVSPGAYIFQRPLLRGLFLEGLIFGGAYLRREICVSISIGLAL